jgi:methylamine---glutamate N-methyltransferase subunit B
MKATTNKMINARSKDLKYTNQAVQESINGRPVVVKNASHLHGLAAGLKHGNVIIEGNAGDYLGVLNDGATIHVTQNVGNYLADNMTRGTVFVDGDALYGPGQYCYGGTIVIRGDAGNFTATMNKGGTIIVCGNVGDEVGTYMLKGELIIVGNAGKNFANYLIRGSIYIGGEWESLGHNTQVETLCAEDIARLQAYFNTYSIEADPKLFKKIVAASEKPFYH